LAVPHFIYLVLKMPGPNGIITVKGSFELSDTCDKEFHKRAQTFGMTAEYGGPMEGTTPNASFSTGQSPPHKVFDATPEAKKIWVHTEDPDNSTPDESGPPTA
jgi:hypothetical protein